MEELPEELQRQLAAFQKRVKESEQKEAEEAELEAEQLWQAYLERRRQAELWNKE